MKKVMILLLLCASFIIAKTDAPSATEGIEVIESIENGDAEGLINALNRENPTQKELNEYISIAQKKGFSLLGKRFLLVMADLSSTIALGFGAIISLIAGAAIGAGTQFHLRRERSSQAKLWKGLTVGAVVGGVITFKWSNAIESYRRLKLNQKMNDLNRRLEKARSILLILKDALQKREK